MLTHKQVAFWIISLGSFRFLSHQTLSSLKAIKIRGWDQSYPAPPHLEANGAVSEETFQDISDAHKWYTGTIRSRFVQPGTIQDRRSLIIRWLLRLGSCPHGWECRYAPTESHFRVRCNIQLSNGVKNSVAAANFEGLKTLRKPHDQLEHFNRVIVDQTCCSAGDGSEFPEKLYDTPISSILYARKRRYPLK